MPDPVVHFEILGRDGEALSSFYGELFGWEIQSIPEMNYHMVQAAEGGIAGGIGQPSDGETSHVTFYVQVPNIAATLDQIAAKGGQVLMPRTELGMVTIALFADPEGHVVGLVEGGASEGG